MKNITIIPQADIAQANCITHGGTFHADEVMATVLLSKLFSEVKVCRTFKVPDVISEDVIVYDIGGGVYDHHQRDFNETRESGVKYSSFGLLWRKFGHQFLANVEAPELVFELFDKGFVEGIDAVDNGQYTSTNEAKIATISGVISAFNPRWDEETNPDEAFIKAVEFAEVMFDNAFNTAISTAKAKSIVETAVEKSANGIMILADYVPWQEHVFSSSNHKAKDILYVVFPSNRGGYIVNCVPDAPGSFGKRKPLPEKWAGLTGKEFAEISGVETANFCHVARFICVADTLVDALKLAEIAVNS